MDSVYNKLSEVLGIRYNEIKLTDKDYKIRHVKTVIRELGVRRLRQLGFEGVTSKVKGICI